MSDEERQGLERSAAHLRETVRQNIGAKSDPSRFRPRPVFQYARYALRPAVGARATSPALPHQGIGASYLQDGSKQPLSD
jgi:hypothetical protein